MAWRWKSIKESLNDMINDVPDGFKYQCNCGVLYEHENDITTCPACHNTKCPSCDSKHGYAMQGKTNECHDPQLMHSHIDPWKGYKLTDLNRGIQSKYIIQGLLKSNSET